MGHAECGNSTVSMGAGTHCGDAVTAEGLLPASQNLWPGDGISLPSPNTEKLGCQIHIGYQNKIQSGGFDSAMMILLWVG